MQNSLGKRFTWRAVYADGSSLCQIDGEKKNAYEDIDRSKLVAFEMWEGDKRLVLIRVGENQRLIWRRRVEMKNSGVQEACHLIGKQETVDGKNYQGVFGLFETDGRLECFGKFEEGHPWAYPPQFKENEQWEK